MKLAAHVSLPRLLVVTEDRCAYEAYICLLSDLFLLKWQPDLTSALDGATRCDVVLVDLDAPGTADLPWRLKQLDPQPAVFVFSNSDERLEHAVADGKFRRPVSSGPLRTAMRAILAREVEP